MREACRLVAGLPMSLLSVSGQDADVIIAVAAANYRKAKDQVSRVWVRTTNGGKIY